MLRAGRALTGARAGCADLSRARRRRTPLTRGAAHLHAVPRALRLTGNAHADARAVHASLRGAILGRSPLPVRAAGLDSVGRGALLGPRLARARARAAHAGLAGARRAVAPGSRRIARLHDLPVALGRGGSARPRARASATDAVAGRAALPGPVLVAGQRREAVAHPGARDAAALTHAGAAQIRTRVDACRRDQVLPTFQAIVPRAHDGPGGLPGARRHDRLTEPLESPWRRVAVLVRATRGCRLPDGVLALESLLLCVGRASVRALFAARISAGGRAAVGRRASRHARRGAGTVVAAVRRRALARRSAPCAVATRAVSRTRVRVDSCVLHMRMGMGATAAARQRVEMRRGAPEKEDAGQPRRAPRRSEHAADDTSEDRRASQEGARKTEGAVAPLGHGGLRGRLERLAAMTGQPEPKPQSS